MDKQYFFELVFTGVIPNSVLLSLGKIYGMDFYMEQFFAVPLIWGNKNGDLVLCFHHIHFLVTLKEGVCVESLGQKKKYCSKHSMQQGKLRKQEEAENVLPAKKLMIFNLNYFCSGQKNQNRDFRFLKDLDQFMNF